MQHHSRLTGGQPSSLYCPRSGDPGRFQQLPDNGMKQLLRAIPISISLSLAIPLAAFGQRTYAVALGGGAAIPVGKLSDTQKTGYSAIAALAIGVAELPLGVRFDGVYNNLRANAQSGTAVNSNFRVMGILANLIFAFPGTNAKPYILVGGGLYNSKSDVPDAKSQNNFGFNAGLGATFGFGPFATFLESRYHSISRNAAKGGVFQFVPITFGVMF
jgi:hypothetical protein